MSRFLLMTGASALAAETILFDYCYALKRNDTHAFPSCT